MQEGFLIINMPHISKIITKIASSKLTKAAKKSALRMEQYKDENLFQSSMLRELMTDRFEYKGSRLDTILVKNRETGHPVKLQVKVKQEPYLSPERHMLRELYELVDTDAKCVVGEKDFYLKRFKDGTYKMFQGHMNNYNPDYVGVGIRLDQMQIERALSLGIDYIPRTSFPGAIIYHTKMGFLPVEKSLDEVKNFKQVKDFLEEDLKTLSILDDISFSYFKPFITNKEDKFYIDLNKTKALASYAKSRDILAKSGHHRILNMNKDCVYMALQGKELEQWREILKSHPILSKLSCVFNNIF